MDKRYWAVRAGRGGEYVDSFEKSNFVAIGWNELGNLPPSSTLDEIKRKYRQTWPDASEGSVGNDCNQIYRFIREFQIGDSVLLIDTVKNRVLLGEITKDYQYKDYWRDDCRFSRRRTVKWIVAEKRSALPDSLLSSLRFRQTICDLSKHAQTIENLVKTIRPGKRTRLITEDEKSFNEEILRRLRQMEPTEFEKFIVALLEAMGFEAEHVGRSGDGGVDAIGMLDANGLVQIQLQVQVKRQKGNVGSGPVLKLRGALGNDDYGVVITTSGFTRQAREAAESERMKQITLIDGITLVELIIRNYENLDDNYKDLFLLKRVYMLIDR